MKPPKENYYSVRGESPCVTFSPDGTYVLLGSRDGSVILYEASSARPIRRFEGHAAPVYAVAFSSDGKLILTGCEDRSALLFETGTGKRLGTFDGHEEAVNAVEFGRDASNVLTGTNRGVAVLWEREGARQVHKWKPHEDAAIVIVAFNADGTQILTSSFDRTLVFWDAQTGDRLRQFPVHGGQLQQVVFNADRSRLATASGDGNVALWNVGTGKRLRVFEGRGIEAAGISADAMGHYLLVGSYRFLGTYSSPAVLWDLAAGKPIRTLGTPSRKRGANGGGTLSRDGRLAATMSGSHVLVWDTKTGKRLLNLDAVHIGKFPTATSAAFSPDASRIVTVGLGETVVWDLATAAKLREFDNWQAGGSRVAFHPDGKHILRGTLAHEKSKGALLWDVDAGELTHEYRGHDGWWEDLAISPDGRFAATAWNDGKAIVWNVATEVQVCQLDGHKGDTQAVTFSPDSRFVLTGAGEEQRAILWEAATGMKIRIFGPQLGEAGSLAFSADGKFIFTASQSDGAVYVWRTDSGDQVAQCLSINEGTDWLVYTPEGLFDCSDAARPFISFRQSGTNTLTTDGAVHERQRRPGLLGAILRDIPPANKKSP